MVIEFRFGIHRRQDLASRDGGGCGRRRRRRLLTPLLGSASSAHSDSGCKSGSVEFRWLPGLIHCGGTRKLSQSSNIETSRRMRRAAMLLYAVCRIAWPVERVRANSRFCCRLPVCLDLRAVWCVLQGGSTRRLTHSSSSSGSDSGSSSASKSGDISGGEAPTLSTRQLRALWSPRISPPPPAPPPLTAAAGSTNTPMYMIVGFEVRLLGNPSFCAYRAV